MTELIIYMLEILEYLKTGKGYCKGYISNQLSRYFLF